MRRIAHWLVPLIIGIVGFLLAWSIWHLYLDHQKHHLIDAQVGVWQQSAIQQEQAQKAAGGS